MHHPGRKVSSQRGSGSSKSSAHQVSYRTASGGDSRRVHLASGLGWRRVSAIMYSASAECVAPECIAKSIPLVETEALRQGQTYHTADGGVIKNKGEKTVTMYSETGDRYRARYQITDVSRPLNSVSRVCDQGNNVLFTQTGGWIINHETGWFSTLLGNTECMCCTHGSMNSQLKNVCDGQMSLFPGRSARIMRFRGTRGTSGPCETSFEDS